MLVNPAANVPIVQVSVLDSEDPKQHYLMGRALGALRAKNIAIIGSGFQSFHNLRLLFSPAVQAPGFREQNDEWNNAVTKAASTEDAELRMKAFEEWRSWPGSYTMHPRGGADHFLPLIVAAGAAGNQKAKMYSDEFMGMRMWSYYWD